MRVAFINTTADGIAAPSRLMLEIVRGVIDSGGEAMIAWGRGDYRGDRRAYTYKIGNPVSIAGHYALATISDAEGLGSLGDTRKLMREIKSYNPDLVHLHNLHGHYINYPFLLESLAGIGIPVVITMHDCWLFTGHCPFYSHSKCRKWMNDECAGACILSKDYPTSLTNRARRNLTIKKSLFDKMRDVTLVAPSKWMTREIKKSYLNKFDCRLINNGINIKQFSPSADQQPREYILGVANRWEKRKNLDHITTLSRFTDLPIKIAGKGTIRHNADNIEYLGPVDNIESLVAIYRKAAVFINPGSAESFGMTTVEALACGVPVVVNDATALREIAGNDKVAVITDTSSPVNVAEAVTRALKLSPEDCREYVARNFTITLMVEKYLSLYKDILE